MHTHIRTIVLVTVLSQTRSANGVEEGSTRGTGGDTRKSECVRANTSTRSPDTIESNLFWSSLLQ